MFRFAVRHVLLSLFVVAVTFGADLAQALNSREREAIEKRINEIETELRSLNESIAASEQWLRGYPWMIAGCPFVRAGVTFVIPKTGAQWTLVDYYAAVDRSTKTPEEKAALKARALLMSNKEAERCRDTYYTSYVTAKAKVTVLTNEMATLRAKLAAPPPAPAVAWSGRYVTPIGTTFNMRIEGAKFFVRATIRAGDDNIYIADECEWNGREPINCTYTERQGDNYNMSEGGYRWSTEGVSKFVWQDGMIIRTAKANGPIAVTFAKNFGAGIIVNGGNQRDVERAKQKVIEEINRKHGAEEYRLRRIGEWDR
jgi:hypothetical protein